MSFQIKERSCQAVFFFFWIEISTRNDFCRYLVFSIWFLVTSRIYEKKTLLLCIWFGWHFWAKIAFFFTFFTYLCSFFVRRFSLAENTWWYGHLSRQLIYVDQDRAATAGKAPKAWALPRFWVSIRSYKKQLVKNIWGRVLGLAWLIFTLAALQDSCKKFAINCRWSKKYYSTLLCSFEILFFWY